MTRKDIRSALIVTGALGFFLISTHGLALQPQFNKWGYVVLKVEHPHDGLRTCFHAVAGGAEIWFTRYSNEIIRYVSSSAPYYAKLPVYGYTRVTAEKLARMLYYDSLIKYRYIQSQLYYTLITALEEDKRYGPAKTVGMLWDPIDIWKWRSVYMERTIGAPNQSGNCFGTADYMTMGDEWIQCYPAFSYPNDLNENRRFPWIYLKGTMSEDPLEVLQCLDNELKQNDFGYAAKSSDNSLYLGKYINCFDLIRVSGPFTSGPDSLTITTMNGTVMYLGEPIHAAVFLCTDRAGNPWVFEKQSQAKPVRVINLYSGTTVNRSYFYRRGNYKKVITDTWEPNWAGVSTIWD